MRLVRHIAPNGQARVLMTNLFDVARFPASRFGELYHPRWRIKEALKRLKHRLSLEHVSGLSQLAVVQDVAAKVLCDNLQALATLEASDNDDLPDRQRINRAYVHTLIPHWKRLGLAICRRLGQALVLSGVFHTIVEVTAADCSTVRARF